MKILSLTLILAFTAVSVKGQEAGPGEDGYSPMITDTDIDNRTLNKTLAVGATPGVLDVTPTGAAVYNVPIQISPGTMGMQPNLSLAYNSQGGRNGLLGYGWNLAGLSSISRVNKTIYHDNVFTNIKNNYEDRFALDGNRLMAIVGEYGYPSTIYGTEVESFARITSYGQLGNGPKWFKVETREGLIMEYGKTPDSRVMDRANNTVIEWKINKTYDKHTNYMEYKYVMSNGQHLINSIDYSGNDTLNHSFPSLGLPYATVQFQYMPRNDRNELFLNEDGKSFKNNNLLKRISLSVDGVTYKQYEMIYGFNFHSYLNEIKEIGLDDTEFNTTSFKYKHNAINLNEQVTNLPYTDVDYYPGDFNGDGLTDVLILHSWLDRDENARFYTHYSMYFKNENGYLEVAQPRWPVGKMSELLFNIADFNGDGKDDILLTQVEYKVKGKTLFNSGVTYGDHQSFTIFYSTSYRNNWSNTTTMLQPPSWYMFSIENGNFLKIGDFNGDGAQDVFWIGADIQERDVNDPDNTFYDYFYFPKLSISFQEGEINSQYQLRDDISRKGQLFVLDYDGDGKSELMHVWNHSAEQYHTDILEFYTTANNTIGYNVIYNQYYPTKYHEHISIADFNGDGKSDILTRLEDNNWEVKQSVGYGFLNYSYFSSTSYPIFNGRLYHDEFKFGDINGDGLNDIIFTDGTTTIESYINTGSGFSSMSFPLTNNNITNSFVIESDGDGSNEIFGRFSVFQGPPVVFDFNQKQRHGLLHKISNGLGVINEVGYQSLSDVDPCYYERKNSAIQPLIDFEKPLFVTKWVEDEARNGSSSKIRTEYFYEEAKIHTEGKGFMGFKKVKAYNYLNKPGETITITESEYNIDTDYFFPFLNRSHKSIASKVVVNGCPSYDIEVNLYSKENQYTVVDKDHGRYHHQLDQTQEGFNTKGSTVTTNYFYTEPFSSTSGFPSTQIVNKGGMEIITTDFDYAQFHTWIPSSLISKVVTVQRLPNPPSTPRILKYDYYTSGILNGNLLRAYKDFNTPNQSSINYESYNEFGQYLFTHKELSNQQSYRIDQYFYDGRGRFLTKKIVNLNGGVDLHQTDYTYNPYWGKVETIEKNTVSTSLISFTYDGFGNKTSEADVFGTTDFIVDWSSSAVGAGGGSNILYFSQSMRANTPEEVNLIDKFGNVRESVVDGYDDKIYHVMEYNEWGKPLSTEGPFYIGATTTPTVSYSYDELQRTIGTTVNGAITSSKAYSGAYEVNPQQPYSFINQSLTTVTMTQADGAVKSVVSDATGKQVQVVDDGGLLEYQYNTQGKVNSISLNSTVINIMQYDDYGRQTELWDINGGTIRYEYDEFDRLTRQYFVDNNNSSHYNITDILYDNLDRVTDKLLNSNLIAEYQYNGVGSYGLGKLGYVKNHVSNISEQYIYNNKELLEEKTDDINGEIFTTEYDYTSDGKLHVETYPSSIGPIEVEYIYNTYGYLKKVQELGGAKVYFETSEMDAMGNYTQYHLGNGITTERNYDDFGYPVHKVAGSVYGSSTSFDPENGNLLSRMDPTHYINGAPLRESFTYDGLSRLDQVEFQNTLALDMSYDASTGSITSKSDIGEYMYTTPKIHAVSTIDNSLDRVAPTPQDITYTDFDSPKEIEENNIKWTFDYGPDLQRKRVKIENPNDADDGQRYRYYGGNYEFETLQGNKNLEVYYIGGGDGLCMIKVVEDGQAHDYYVYTDYLGSIEKITDAHGDLIYEQSFDAWGAQRDPETWDGSSGVAGAVPSHFIAQDKPEWLWRGYTGHEHMDEFQLINMNGRVYDPYVGRMLSVDNYNQNSTSTQNFDRYAYALNNPLKYTDPSGEIVWVPIIIGAVIGAYIGGTTANGTYNPGKWDYSSGQTWGYMLGGAVVGGISGGLAYGVATSGMAFANTAAIATGSYVNSIGMHMVTGGQTDVSVGFGVGSYNLSTGELGYLGKKDNTALENIGYSLGALANVADILTGLKPGSVELRTENTSSPGDKDIIGHSQIVDENGTPLVDWGPDERLTKDAPFRTVRGTNSYENGVPIPSERMKWDALTIDGVNTSRISNWNPTGKYNLGFNSCVSQTSRALNSSGVFNVGIHPYLLHGQMYLRSIGVRPYLFSSYMHQY